MAFLYVVGNSGCKHVCAVKTEDLDNCWAKTLSKTEFIVGRLEAAQSLRMKMPNAQLYLKEVTVIYGFTCLQQDCPNLGQSWKD